MVSIISDILGSDPSLSVGLCSDWDQLRVGRKRPISKSGSRLAQT